MRQALRADTAVMAVTQGVYDQVPAGSTYPYLVVLHETTLPERGQCWDAAEHFVNVHVWSRPKDRGAKECLGLCGLVRTALDDAELDLGPGVALALLQSETQRVFSDDDDVTWHGVVTYRAETHEV